MEFEIDSISLISCFSCVKDLENLQEAYSILKFSNISDLRGSLMPKTMPSGPVVRGQPGSTVSSGSK